MRVTNFHAILVSDKPSAQGIMNIFLKEAGISSFSVATSFRDAVALVAKEFAHIIVCVDDLPDATAVQTIDAVRKTPVGEKSIVFVMRNCTQSEIMAFMKLKISALVAKDSDPNLLIEKIKQKLALLQDVSPFSIRAEEIPGGPNVTIRSRTKIIGRHWDHVVCSSSIEAKSGTMLSILPETPGVEPFAVTFTGASITASKEAGRENIFHISDVVGKGREWLEKNLPVLQDNGSSDKRKLLVFDRNIERTRSLPRALSIHNLECDFVSDVGILIEKYKTAKNLYGAVFFPDPMEDALEVVWEGFKGTLEVSAKPLELRGTLTKKESGQLVVWMQKPFGLDHLVQNFRAGLTARHRVVDPKSLSARQIPAEYIAPAKILALDELGVLLQAPFHPEVGTELSLENAFISSLPIFSKVKVTAVKGHELNPKLAIVRAQVLDAGCTKDKLYAAERLALEAAANATVQQAAASSGLQKPRITSLRVAAAQIATQQPVVSAPKWSAQKQDPMPKFEVKRPAQPIPAPVPKKP
jgi:CheY-like chemotaxis protein